ncbi:IS1634 family transposase [Anaerovorax odorimutans]|uniref:IS1634 family transposase n=1 Tax=Anaerovorax odorimutans TaxID=109327 RepID=A0ABT1RTT2_9FIRM|nr:IS1634 family transposase [Anaerovorax odorimutans]MCQ4638614.1 IS1634 family transposase [Anaerovorax odorimutans]
MRVRTGKTSNGRLFYIIKTYYDTKGVEHTITVEKLGNEHDIRQRTGRDPDEWARERAKYLTEKEKEANKNVTVEFSPSSLLTKDYQYTFNIGYLFLQKIFHELKLDQLCAAIQADSKITFNLSDSLAKLCYGRILHPSSKLATFAFSKTLLEQPDFEEHQMYRALDVLADHFDTIQAGLYKNSFALGNRNTSVIYYDCTNFFFEAEEPDADGLRRHGKSKENRPLPLVEMGLFIDQDGIPLTMSIHPGNTNEQTTLKPLEKKLLRDFALSKFIVCTDAGLCSKANKRFNSLGNRAFITTQSLKKLNKDLRETALSPTQWRLMGDKQPYKSYDITKIDEEKHPNSVFYKELPVDHTDFDERILVTYSIKYRDYTRKIREGQVARAEKALKNSGVRAKKHANDFRRFIRKECYTADGELAEKSRQSIDVDAIAKEARYDGFYAVSTNLMDDDPSDIAAVSHQRWQIEQCFRTMKSEFKARPAYVRKDNRIKAHFLTCFIALVLYKYLEKRLGNNYSCEAITDTLRNMEVRELVGEGYLPTYTRTTLTDDLHETFGFRTDYQIVTKAAMKKVVAASKKRKLYAKKA